MNKNNYFNNLNESFERRYLSESFSKEESLTENVMSNEDVRNNIIDGLSTNDENLIQNVLEDLRNYDSIILYTKTYRGSIYETQITKKEDDSFTIRETIKGTVNEPSTVNLVQAIDSIFAFKIRSQQPKPDEVIIQRSFIEDKNESLNEDLSSFQNKPLKDFLRTIDSSAKVNIESESGYDDIGNANGNTSGMDGRANQVQWYLADKKIMQIIPKKVMPEAARRFYDYKVVIE